MRVILLATILAFGVGAFVATGAQAATDIGLKDAAKAASSLRTVKCRPVRTCRVSPYAGHRRTCTTKQVCD